MRLTVLIFLSVFSVFGFSQELPKQLHLSTENGLLQNTIWAVEEDFSNRIWIGTHEGIQIYDGYKLQTIPVIKETILALYHQDSNMYCVTLGNLYRINEVDLSFKKVAFQNTDYYFRAFHDNIISITSSDGKKTANFDLELHLIDSSQTYSQTLFTCDETFGPFHITGNHNGITYKTRNPTPPKGFVFQVIKQEPKTVTTNYCTQLVRYDSNHIFISSYKGLIELITRNDSLIIRHHFTQNRIEKLMVDGNQNLWVGTADIGLILIHRNAILSEFYPLKNEKDEDLTVWSIFEKKHTLNISTNEGIKEIAHPERQSQLTKLTRPYNCLSVHSAENFTLIGTSDNGLLRFENNTLKSVYKNPKLTLDNTVIQIIANKIGFLAISKYSFIQLDKSGEFLFTKPYEFSKGNNFAMYVEPIENGYRVCTISGVYVLDFDLEITQFIESSASHSTAMTATFQGNLWASTFDAGLINLSQDSILKTDEPIHNFLTLKNIGNKILWASANTGIFQYQPPYLRPFTSFNGIAIKEFNQLSTYQEANGNLWYGGNGGVITFAPSQMDFFPNYPTTILKSKNALLDSSQIIHLPFDQAELKVAVLPVLITDQNYFKIELHLNDSVIVLDKPTEISLPIPYKNSTLKLVITDKIHHQNKVFSYAIQRAIPFWQELWFMAVSAMTVILLIIGLISFIGFIKTKKKLKTEQAENQINEERLRIAKELHDNIGARLTHIISSLDVEMYRNKSDHNSIENINAFARDTMAQLRETIWAVSDKTIFFSEFATRVDQYIAEINNLSPIPVSYQQATLTDFELNPVQTINFYRIVQEAINNAVKYSQASKIEVSILQNEALITIQITDNGAGFDLKNTRFGTGLKGMKTRAKEVNAVLEIHSSMGNGTEISLEIKFV